MVVPMLCLALPLPLRCAPAGMLLSPESPRWLASKGKEASAEAAALRLWGPDGQAELALAGAGRAQAAAGATGEESRPHAGACRSISSSVWCGVARCCLDTTIRQGRAGGICHLILMVSATSASAFLRMED